MQSRLRHGRQFAQAALLIWVLGGCGYTARSLVTQKFRTIYIPQFVNKIDISREGESESKYKLYRPMLEIDITNSLITRFLLDGNLKPVKSKDADLILKGELVSFDRDALRYTSDDVVEEYRINLIVNISLMDAQENKLLWEEKNFAGTTTYFTQGVNAKTETVAVNDAITDLSRRIVERAVEEW